MHTITLSYKILEKYTSHTTARRTLFIHAFCHTRVENLLKGPDVFC